MIDRNTFMPINQIIQRKLWPGFIIALWILCAFTCHPKDPCEKVVCTMEFRMLTVTLLDTAGAPFLADSLITLNESNQVWLKSTEPLNSTSSQFVYADDGFKPRMDIYTATPFKIQVYKAGVLKKEALLSLAKDCCHIQKSYGPDTLVINP